VLSKQKSHYKIAKYMLEIINLNNICYKKIEKASGTTLA
jgi:hypothetical protein